MNKIYRRIKDIAKRSIATKTPYTRADLAYELQDLGVTEDSLEIGRLVWEAYDYFNENPQIAKAFLTNEKKQSIIEEYTIHYLIGLDKEESIFNWVNAKLQNSKSSLYILNKQLSKGVGNSSNQSFDILSAITGTKGINIVQADAIRFFNKYSEVVNSYVQAKTDIQSVVKDFVGLRGYVAKIYQDYATKLIEIYGDSIKSISPILFNFDKIQFLDVENMMRDTKLEYDHLLEKCSTILSELKDSFGQSLNQSIGSYNATDNKSIGLAFAGMNMIGHYLDAHEKTQRSKNDLETLKLSIKHDVTTIKGDYNRLAIIFKTLNDVYIPKANAFCKYSEHVLSSELNQLFASLYQDPEISSLIKQREVHLTELRHLESSIVDTELNICYYTNAIEHGQQLLNNTESNYQLALQQKPYKPFLLVNLLTFGSAKKRYNRNIYEWSATCAPVVKEYEECQADLKLDGDELKKLRSELKKEKNAYKVLKNGLLKEQAKIAHKIHVSDDIKLRMASHLEAIIKLLHTAKDIMESKLDDKYLNAVKITDYREIRLPEELKDSVQTFTKTLRKNLVVDSKTAAKSICNVDGTASPDEIENIANAQNELIQKSIDCLETWMDLKMKQAKGKLVKKAYDAELKKLQDDFQKEMSAIDNQSKLLNEILKRINTATNSEQLKEGLLLLASHQTPLTKDDLNQFLNGTKRIEI